MKFSINLFQGEFPKISDRLQKNGQASAAVNVRLDSGALQAYPGDLTGETLTIDGGDVSSIHRWRVGGNNYWFRFKDDVDVVRSPIADDANVRVYWTGDSRSTPTGEDPYPMMSYTPAAYTGGDQYPVVSYRLGIPAPTVPMAASAGTAIRTVTDIIVEKAIRVEAVAHGFDNGHQVKLTDIVGAIELNDRTFDVTYVDADHFELAGEVGYLDITGATAANPVVLTINSHGLQSGKTIRISDIAGMTELNGRTFTITRVASDKISLNGENGTAYAAYTSGGKAWVVADYVSGGHAERVYDDGDIGSRFYVYTYVSAVGEEGPPSPPSARIDHPFDGKPVNVSGWAVDASASESRNIDRIRIYRTATSSSAGSGFLFVGELPISTTDWVDNINTSDLAEPLPSTTWFPPPQGMKGLTLLSSGIGVGFLNNELIPSEPFLLHAYPEEYRLTMDHPIVGIGGFDTSIVVATEGAPYLVTGWDPQSYQCRKLPLNEACVSKGSVVSFGYGVVYASNAGLVLVGPGGARVVSADVIVPEEWRAGFFPATIQGFEWRGLYVGFYDGGFGSRRGFVFDPRSPASGFIQLDRHYVTGYRDTLEDVLYLVNESGQLHEFCRGVDLQPYRWRSKAFYAPRPISMGVASVMADSYDNLIFRVVADDVVVHSQDVSSSEPFSLPDGFKARKWAIELEGTDTVIEAAIASGLAELGS